MSRFQWSVGRDQMVKAVVAEPDWRGRRMKGVFVRFGIAEKTGR